MDKDPVLISFKKFVMALAGMFLLLFLPVHLVINLMLLKDDPEPFNTAARFMASFPVIKIIEIILFAALLIHLSYGIYLQIQNWLARTGRLCCRKQIRNIILFSLHDMDGFINTNLPCPSFFQFYFIRLGLVPGDPENFYSTAHALLKSLHITIFTLPALFYWGFIFFMPFPRHFIHWDWITGYGPLLLRSLPGYILL